MTTAAAAGTAILSRTEEIPQAVAQPLGDNERHSQRQAQKNVSGLLSLPKHGAAISGAGETFDLDLFTGSPRVSIPLTLSPGREGFGPSHSIRYHATGANGPVGVGWQLDVPTVHRQTRRGVPRYGKEDTFVLSGVGDLVTMADGQRTVEGFVVTPFRPRFDEAFSRIELWESAGRTRDPLAFWVVTDAQNVTRVYGINQKGRIKRPVADAHKAPGLKGIPRDDYYLWSLEFAFDGRGNVIHYVYKLDAPTGRPEAGATIYLKRIRYGNLEPAKPSTMTAVMAFAETASEDSRYYFEAVLDYGEHGETVDGDRVISKDDYRETAPWAQRSDSFSTYNVGFELRTNRLLRRVLMFHGAHSADARLLVASTDLTYKLLPFSRSSTLQRVVKRRYAASTDATWKLSEDYVAGGRTGVKSKSLSIGSIPPIEFTYQDFQVPEGVTIGPEPSGKPDEQAASAIHVSGSGCGCMRPPGYPAASTTPVNFPAGGLSDARTFLIDLFGRGLPDVVESGESYTYWQNLGNGRFAKPQWLGKESTPAATLDQPNVMFSALSSRGHADIIAWHDYDARIFLNRRSEGDEHELGWSSTPQHMRLPEGLNGASSTCRLCDLTGNGRLDALIISQGARSWYECLGPQGFSKRKPVEAPSLPNFGLSDHGVHLMDMTGDGLVDIVKIDVVRLPNGTETQQVRYWPNLGHGRFGSPVTMGWETDQRGGADGKTSTGFGRHVDISRVYFVDLDGTGPADMVLVGDGRVHIWFNQSGEVWSKPVDVSGTPPFSTVDRPVVTDLYGHGHSGLLWSGSGQFGYRYFSLSRERPGLLTEATNNCGRRVRYEYVPTTDLMLQAQETGARWLERLPFPMHVLSKIEHFDDVSKGKLTSTFSYAHGYYDEEEREFVGFGRVDQRDAETVGPAASKLDQQPVLSRNWFHLGTRRGTEEHYRSEYFGGDSNAPQLGSFIPSGLSPAQRAEALRALRGRVLRKETYEADSSGAKGAPYSASEFGYTVRSEQAAHGGHPASHSAYRSETVTLQYEQQADDPRCVQELTLGVDAYNHPTESATIAYPRRSKNVKLPEQGRPLITYTKRQYAAPIDTTLRYRHGLKCAESTWELSGYPLEATKLITAEELMSSLVRARTGGAALAANQQEPTKSLVAKSLSYFLADDATTRLPFGISGSLSLPWNTYTLALDAGLVSETWDGSAQLKDLLKQGGYVEGRQLGGESGWWIPSGDPGRGERKYVPERFYLPASVFNVFGAETKLEYDRYHLLIERVEDALQNVTLATNDYRVLAPKAIEDPNGNRQKVLYDTLGVVVATAVMGKNGETLGDRLDSIDAHLSDVVRRSHLRDPEKNADDLLGAATARVVYSLWRYLQEKQPVTVHVMKRVTHASDLQPGEQTHVQHTIEYFDGFNRVIQTKVSSDAERATQPTNGCSAGKDARWVVSGRTMFNNKGNAVKQYEPFFSAMAGYDAEKSVSECGVAATFKYDPLSRVIRVDNPDKTFTRTEFTAWQKLAWDENDTVLKSAWYKQVDSRSDAEKRAARLASQHAETPTSQHLDPLGRVFLDVRHNRAYSAGKAVESFHETRFGFDIRGNLLSVRDARGLEILQQRFDRAGRSVRTVSPDAGVRRVLPDALGSPVQTWDARGRTVRFEYDPLRRPTHRYVADDDVPESLVEYTIYGESLGASARASNHRGKVYREFDSAGVVIHSEYDFKGNPKRVERRLAKEYRRAPDWTAIARHRPSDAGIGLPEALLEPELYGTSSNYDAMNRLVSRTTHDGTETRVYYNRRGLLARTSVRSKRASDPRVIVDHIEYNARGQRSFLRRGNGVVSHFAYHPESFRLVRSTTSRGGGERLQDAHYTYDAVGNLTEVEDRAQFAQCCAPTRAPKRSRYAYDALYRLTHAEGREHPGQQGSPSDSLPAVCSHPNDRQALRTYTEDYFYDPDGNIERIVHRSGSAGWTRSYAYERDAANRPQSSRLVATSVPGDPRDGPYSAKYQHDANGNIIRMPHLERLEWDAFDRLVSVDLGGGGTAHYTYNASGERIRKVVVKDNVTEERIYLADFEIYRKRVAGTVEFERQSLHVTAGNTRLALLETKTAEDRRSLRAPTRRERFQLDDPLGSSLMELDDKGDVIGCEEYFPFGGTSYHSVRAGVEVSAKRFRYNGKERDEETSLYYYGARYYAPWLGRWTSTDPAGLVDGVNLYAYSRANPIGNRDPTGHRSVPFDDGSPAPEEEEARMSYAAGATTPEGPEAVCQGDAKHSGSEGTSGSGSGGSSGATPLADAKHSGSEGTSGSGSGGSSGATPLADAKHSESEGTSGSGSSDSSGATPLAGSIPDQTTDGYYPRMDEPPASPYHPRMEAGSPDDSKPGRTDLSRYEKRWPGAYGGSIYDSPYWAKKNVSPLGNDQADIPENRQHTKRETLDDKIGRLLAAISLFARGRSEGSPHDLDPTPGPGATRQATQRIENDAKQRSGRLPADRHRTEPPGRQTRLAPKNPFRSARQNQWRNVYKW